MAADPYYSRCCLTEAKKEHVKIEWHHNLIYGGKQVNEPWCILPVSEAIHILARRTDVKERLNWVMLNRATTGDLERFSKVINYVEMRDKLNAKYGEWKSWVK